jgi:hypothetical protein
MMRFVSGSRKHLQTSVVELDVPLYNNVRFANTLDLKRLNKLFAILHEQEKNLRPKMKLAYDSTLKLISFERIKDIKLNQTTPAKGKLDFYYDLFYDDIDRFLKVNMGTHLIEATEEFSELLKNISIRYAVNEPRTMAIKRNIDPVSTHLNKQNILHKVRRSVKNV